MFTLYEEMLLLAVHEEKGAFIGSSLDLLKPGLAGAILAELALKGKIQATDNQRLHVVDDGLTEIAILDDVLHVLKESEKERKFGFWINALSQGKEKYRKQIAASLIEKGVFTQDDEHLAWVVPSPINKEASATTKYWVNLRLRGSVLASTEIEPRDIVLLSLIRACGLLYLVFLRDERKHAGRMINQCFYNRAISDPVFQTIQEIERVLSDLVEDD